MTLEDSMNIIDRFIYWKHSSSAEHADLDYERFLTRELKPYIDSPQNIILGQEAICPDGLGRVINTDDKWIQVQTYVNDRSCKWDPKNVTLINPFK
jgi:hypothetical protein